MQKVLLIILLGVIVSQSIFEEDVFNRHVSEEYCNNVIGNMTALIQEGYIYLDFLKAPKQPKGKENYITKVDLISELNNINTTNRTFYDFYGDIQEVLIKARDNHFVIIANEKTDIYFHYFCIPFYFYVKEVLDENGKVNDTYLTIKEYFNYCPYNYSEEIFNKIKELGEKKILKINGLGPYEYLDEMSKKGHVYHSPQSRYIFILSIIYSLPLYVFPIKKNDLTINIQFENEEQEFEIDYHLEQIKFFSEEFKQYYIKERNNYFKLNMPIQKFEEIEYEFKVKKGLIKKNLLKDTQDFWELKSDDENIKCRVDKDNGFNVLLQTSFLSDNFDNYENIMYQCFSKFYSNDYKIIIIEKRNGGGYGELCLPFTQYLHPKILKSRKFVMKATDLIKKNFFLNDDNLNPDTCFPYTEEDNLLEGNKDIYNDGIDEVTHQKTKEVEFLNIYERKIMDNKIREFLQTGKTKKPTEILVFTDGYSFSCTSIFIKGLQVNGHGIVVGYQSRPDLNKEDFDASQSNSAPDTFSFSEFAQNLNELGFNSYITFVEEFDRNDKEQPKVPMEFKIYPVDEISDIYTSYTDAKYDRFINVAKSIFDKYNDLENGECNPENKYLYFETNDCDSKLNIDKAHGGYLCGENGKWDINNCIVAYCDQGYYLNDDRTECIKNPCEEIKLKQISINEEKDNIFDIEPNNTYIFTIETKNKSYYFYSEIENLFYVMNNAHILKPSPNGTEFTYQDKIYVNYFVNITENTTLSIVLKNKHNNDDSDKNGLSTGILVLIIVGSALVLIIIIVLIVICVSRKNKLSNSEIEEKTQQLNAIEGN